MSSVRFRTFDSDSEDDDNEVAAPAQAQVAEKPIAKTQRVAPTKVEMPITTVVEVASIMPKKVSLQNDHTTFSALLMARQRAILHAFVAMKNGNESKRRAALDKAAAASEQFMAKAAKKFELSPAEEKKYRESLVADAACSPAEDIHCDMEDFFSSLIGQDMHLVTGMRQSTLAAAQHLISGHHDDKEFRMLYGHAVGIAGTIGMALDEPTSPSAILETHDPELWPSEHGVRCSYIVAGLPTIINRLLRRKIPEVIARDKNLDTANQILENEGSIYRKLSKSGDFTFFVPQNSAFLGNLPLLATLKKDAAKAKEVFNLHLVETKRFDASDITETPQPIFSVDGTPIVIYKLPDGTIIVYTDPNVRLKVTQKIRASNGKIFVIDGVLSKPSESIRNLPPPIAPAPILPPAPPQILASVDDEFSDNDDDEDTKPIAHTWKTEQASPAVTPHSFADLLRRASTKK